MNKMDSTLQPLTISELQAFREVILGALYDQPHHESPAFNPSLAYEMSVLNWDIVREMSGMGPFLFDEWWTGEFPSVAPCKHG